VSWEETSLTTKTQQTDIRYFTCQAPPSVAAFRAMNWAKVECAAAVMGELPEHRSSSQLKPAPGAGMPSAHHRGMRRCTAASGQCFVYQNVVQ
jgi:hypothetical protein